MKELSLFLFSFLGKYEVTLSRSRQTCTSFVCERDVLLGSQGGEEEDSSCEENSGQERKIERETHTHKLCSFLFPTKHWQHIYVAGKTL